jgi:hypothetical protein
MTEMAWAEGRAILEEKPGLAACNTRKDIYPA